MTKMIGPEALYSQYFSIAEKKLTTPIFQYVSKSEGTINQKAFLDFGIYQRVLNNSGQVSTVQNLLDHSFSMPLGLAPMAFHNLVHEGSELTLADVSQKTNTFFVAPLMGTASIEEIGHTHKVSFGFQLHLFSEIDITLDLIRRAELAGCSAIFLTIDVPPLTSNSELPKLCSSNLSKYDDYPKSAKEIKRDANWDLISSLCKETNLPIYLKGILHPDDAKSAVTCGVKGIVISNHGLRHFHGNISTIEVLPSIRRVVPKDFFIGLDGGVRNGKDIYIALALGTDYVFIGTPMLIALAADGKNGAVKLLHSLKKDFEDVMHCTTCPDLHHLKRFAANNLQKNRLKFTH